MLILRFLTLLIFTSCSLFRATPSLKNQDREKLLNSIRVVGEGTGRLSFREREYVFGVESGLKENYDWILAVSIPLHGEEVMVLPELQKITVEESEIDSFEKRIAQEFRTFELPDLSSKQFLKEVRSLMRFRLSPAWGQKRQCMEHICELDGEKFVVQVEEKEIFITKMMTHESRVTLAAKNLTEPFFGQTEIRLYSNTDDWQKKKAIFSLELFWKD